MCRKARRTAGDLLNHFTTWARANRRSALRRKNSQDLLEFVADFPQAVGRRAREWQRGLRARGPHFFAQLLACTGDGEAFVVEQALDAQRVLDLALPIHA